MKVHYPRAVRLSACVLAFAGLLGSIAQAEDSIPVVFDEMAPVMHNGSLMLMTQVLSRIEIRYENPKAGLSVTKGTLLFAGARDDRGGYAGTAYIFKKDCPPIPYAVTGSVSKSGAIVLVGPAPRRDPKTCDAMTGSANPSSSRLVFEFEPEQG